MGIGAKIFNIFHKKRDPTSTMTKLISSALGDFININSQENNITFLSAINAHARNFSKVEIKCFRNGELDNSRQSKNFNYLLNYKPNDIQVAADFLQCISDDYYQGNLCIIYVEHDYTNIHCPIKSLWVVDYMQESVQVRENNGRIIYQFRVDGKTVLAKDEDIILLARDVSPAKLFGKRSKAIMQTLNVINTSYQGVEKAIKNASFIRFLLASPTVLTTDVKKERAEDFANSFLKVENASGIAYVDGATEITQINAPPKYSNAEEIKTFKDDIYEYLGITPKIIKGEYTEDEFQSYYEASIEPLLAKLSQKLTVKFYSQKEIMQGCVIQAIGNRLQTASLKTRVQIASAMLRLPVIKPNTILDLLYLSPLENGEKEYATLNYVDASKMDEYQEVGSQKEKEEESKDGQKNTD